MIIKDEKIIIVREHENCTINLGGKKLKDIYGQDVTYKKTQHRKSKQKIETLEINKRKVIYNQQTSYWRIMQ